MCNVISCGSRACLIAQNLSPAIPPEDMAGPSDVAAHEPNPVKGRTWARLGKITDAEFVAGIEAIDGVTGVQKPEGVSEAGDPNVKLATGHGTVSMGKLREALGTLQHPGAQLIAKGMAATSFFGGPLPPTGRCSFCGSAEHSSELHLP